MNAGCYGRETKDVLVEAHALNRQGKRVTLKNADFHFSYRHTEASEELIFVEALFEERRMSRRRSPSGSMR